MKKYSILAIICGIFVLLLFFILYIPLVKIVYESDIPLWLKLIILR